MVQNFAARGKMQALRGDARYNASNSSAGGEEMNRVRRGAFQHQEASGAGMFELIQFTNVQNNLVI